MVHIVTTTRVRFPGADGATLVGDLYRPADVEGPAPALVVTGSWLTVKEQMPALYARRMAEQGFRALAFDFTGFGQSAGDPREVEDPVRKAGDIHSAVSFLSTVDDVDPARIGGLGICASSGYQAHNAASDPRIKAIGMVAPWLHTPELVAPYYGGADGVTARIAAGHDARHRYESNGEVDYVPAISADDPTAAMSGPFDYYLDPRRGAIPEWPARFATMAWVDWLCFDAVALARQVSQPVAMIHSHDGAVPDGAQAFYDGLSGRKDLCWIDGGQLDFYDQPTQVDQAVRFMTEHFTAAL